MPRLLPHDALDMPSFKARWTALAALATLALPSAFNLAVDAAPSSLTQQTAEFAWDADALEAGTEPAETALAALLTDTPEPQGAQLKGSADGDAFTLTAAWEPGATITEIRLDHYTDHHGEGLRLGVAAQTTTHTGEHCLAIAVTGLGTDIGDTSLHTCVRTDAQTQNDTYPGRGDIEPAEWAPGHLFLTQTTQVTPTTTGEHLVDYLGIGANPGDSYETGLWGPHWWQPMGYDAEYGSWRQSCEDPDATVALHAPPVAAAEPPDLPIPACVPITYSGSMNPQSFTRFNTAPFTTSAPSPLSSWARYNDAAGQSRAVAVAAVADLRVCDTDIDRCHTDTGADWLHALLGADCIHAIGRPCPGIGPDD